MKTSFAPITTRHLLTHRSGLAHPTGYGLIWRNFGNGYVGHTGGLIGVTSSLNLDPSNKLGLLIFTNLIRKTTVHPGGKIYELLRQEAAKYR